MAILVSEKDGGTAHEPIPAGNYMARCYQVIHLGNIKTVYEGQEKDQDQLMIGWELPTEQRVFKEENGSQPLVVSRIYTRSLGDRATLRAMLESWRGRAFSSDELKGFDISKLIGAPCLINIKNVAGEGKHKGKTFSQIASVSPLMKGMTCPPAINQTVEFSVLSFDDKVFSTLPQWLSDKIKTSKEYRDMVHGGETEKETTHEPMIDDDLGLPF